MSIHNIMYLYSLMCYFTRVAFSISNSKQTFRLKIMPTNQRSSLLSQLKRRRNFLNQLLQKMMLD